MIITSFIFIMVLVLLWQTFPLRYGLLTVLIREFKWTFIVVLGFLGNVAAYGRLDRARARHAAERVSEPGQRVQRLEHLEQQFLCVPVLLPLPDLSHLLRLPPQLQHKGSRPELLPP